MRKPRNPLSQGAMYAELRKVAKDLPTRTKVHVAQPEHTRTYPSLTLRQANILLVAIGEVMHTPLMVDGVPVTGHEWTDLIRELVR